MSRRSTTVVSEDGRYLISEKLMASRSLLRRFRNLLLRYKQPPFARRRLHQVLQQYDDNNSLHDKTGGPMKFDEIGSNFDKIRALLDSDKKRRVVGSIT